MRKTTLLWLILAVFCGAGIFRTSQKVHDERAKIAALNAAIVREGESLRVLNAEWSYLNQPARLEKLAKTYLHLAPLKGNQFIKTEDIPRRQVADATAAETADKKPEEEKPEINKIVEKKTTRPQTPAIKTLAETKKVKEAHILSLPAQGSRKADVKAASLDKAHAAPHSFADVMKNLRQGIE